MIGNRETRNQKILSTPLETGKKSKKQKGFTLMEILVVMAVFLVSVVIIVDVFLLSLRSQRQTSQRQQVTANLRYVMEMISRQVRTSEIDYGYGSSAVPYSELHLIDQEKNNFVYYSAGGEVKMKVDGQESALTSLDDVVVTNLDFYVDPVTNPFSEERCNYSLRPNNTGCLNNNISCTVNDDTGRSGFCCCTDNADCSSQNCDMSRESKDMYTAYCASGSGGICLPFNRQPRVTIVIGFKSAGVKAEEQKMIYLQTTVSSRVYKR